VNPASTANRVIPAQESVQLECLSWPAIDVQSFSQCYTPRLVSYQDSPFSAEASATLHASVSEACVHHAVDSVVSIKASSNSVEIGPSGSLVDRARRNYRTLPAFLGCGNTIPQSRFSLISSRTRIIVTFNQRCYAARYLFALRSFSRTLELLFSISFVD
jgi:hypothetical protein